MNFWDNKIRMSKQSIEDIHKDLLKSNELYDEDINGSAENIAGILSENRRVLGLMPHPERAADAALGGQNGADMFRSLAQSVVVA